MSFRGTKGKWKVEEHPLYYWEVVSETDLICVTGEIGEEAKYNAQLISCAPEMLEALEEVIRLKMLISYPKDTSIEHHGEAFAVQSMLHGIEQLIKKATEI